MYYDAIEGTDQIDRVRDGRVFGAGSGKLTLSAAGHVRSLLENPAGSGKLLNVFSLVAFTTGNAFGQLMVNPSTGLPTVAKTINNQRMLHPRVSVATLKVDTDLTVPLAGGTDTGQILGIGANSRQDVRLPPMVVPPGISVGINVPFAGAAEASLNVYWWEEPV